MTDEEILEDIRAQIAAVDKAIVIMIQRRLSHVLQANVIKLKLGRKIHDRERERELIGKAAWAGNHVVAAYQGVIRACRAAAEAILPNPLHEGGPSRPEEQTPGR